MKTLVLGILLLGSVGLNLYLLNATVVMEDDLDDNLTTPLDEVKVAQSAVNKIKVMKNSLRIHDMKSSKPDSGVSKISRKEKVDDKILSNFSDKYREEKEKWDSDLREFLEYEISLSTPQIQEIIELRDRRERERSDYFSEKIDQEGKSSFYIHTAQDRVDLAKIDKKYIEMIKQILGEDGYTRYQSFRDDYNAKKIDGKKEVYHFIEF